MQLVSRFGIWNYESNFSLFLLSRLYFVLFFIISLSTLFFSFWYKSLKRDASFFIKLLTFLSFDFIFLKKLYLSLNEFAMPYSPVTTPVLNRRQSISSSNLSLVSILEMMCSYIFQHEVDTSNNLQRLITFT